jgi:chorismate synthase
VAEAMLALVLMDHALRQRAQCADVQCATPRIAAAAPPEVIERLRAQRDTTVEDPEPDEA